jgi:hypothetical protein
MFSNPKYILNNPKVNHQQYLRGYFSDVWCGYKAPKNALGETLIASKIENSLWEY